MGNGRCQIIRPLFSHPAPPTHHSVLTLACRLRFVTPRATERLSPRAPLFLRPITGRRCLLFREKLGAGALDEYQQGHKHHLHPVPYHARVLL